MIDESPIVCVARHGSAPALCEQFTIERSHPCQIRRLFPRIQPARGACDVENRTAVGGRGRMGRDSIDSPAVGREPEHPAHDVVVAAGQIIVRHTNLSVGEPLLE